MKSLRALWALFLALIIPTTKAEAITRGALIAVLLGAGAFAIVAGTTPISGTCTNGFFLYNNAGVVGCSASASSIALPQALTGGATGAILETTNSSTMNIDSNITVAAGAITLGAPGTAGSVTMGNATSGTITLQPTTGALGTVTATLPANTGTIAELNLAETWTAIQTFTNSDFRLLGSSTGYTTFTSGNAGASNYTLTFPAVTDTLATIGTAQSWSAVQTFAAGDIALTGATTGCATFTGTILSSTGVACGSGGGTPSFPVTVTGTVTSGGVPYFSSTTVESSSVLLTQYALTIGGGAGAGPYPLASLGTTTTVLHGNASNNPSWGAVNLATDVTGALNTTVDARTTTTETVNATSAGKLVTFSNTSATAAALVTPVGNTGLTITLQNLNTGVVTITPAAGTINGAGTFVLQQKEGVSVVSDGTNWQVATGMGGITIGAIVTGTCANGYNLYNNSGAIGCQANGGGGGTVTGSGASGQIASWSSASAITGTANATISAGALTLGASGTLGSIQMGNATSGAMTIEPATGALGSGIVYIPSNATSDTLVTLTNTQTLTNKTLTSPSLTTPTLGVAAGTSLSLGGATIGSNALAVTGTTLLSGAVTHGVQQTSQGSIVLANTAAGAFSTTIVSSNSASAAYTLILPTTVGSANQCLGNSATPGTMTWNTCSGGGGLTVGTTTTSGGAAGQIMYDTGSVLQESTAKLTSGGVLTLGSPPNYPAAIVAASGVSIGFGFGYGGVYFINNAGNPFVYSGNQAGVGWILDEYLALNNTKDTVFGWATGMNATYTTAIGRDADGIVGLRVGTNPQTLRVYETTDLNTNGSQTNYAYGFLDAGVTTANTLTLGTTQAGTGSLPKLQLSVTGTNQLDFAVTTASTWTFASKIAVPGTTSPLITTTAAITTCNGGTCASAGTITNAPSVGNPTKWIAINDAGTTRYIPAW